MKHKGTKDTKSTKQESNDLSREIIGAALDVHRELGPGLLESVYEECLAHELALRRVPFARQYKIPVIYKGICIRCGYRTDLIVGNRVIVELKSVERILPIHQMQLLTCLRATDIWLGLLINFNAPLLKRGIQRIVA